ncbi:MAG: hypothetical protein ACRCVX_08460 [Shewanella sp.]
MNVATDDAKKTLAKRDLASVLAYIGNSLSAEKIEIIKKAHTEGLALLASENK